MMTVATKIDWMVTICQELVLSVYMDTTHSWSSWQPNKNYYHYLDSMRILKIRDIEQNAQVYPG